MITGSRSLTVLFLSLSALLILPTALYAADGEQEQAEELADMSLEELMNLVVTSVSKKEEKVFDAPAAVFIITADDIRRSGATSVPEALRLAPGVHVAKVNNSQWAITARGFNGLFANKLLVLIDGRTVYTPLFAGVFWDTQDVLLEDIDRIEVIRPGATLWGANAVNGVINIIRKTSGETQGGLVSAAVELKSGILQISVMVESLARTTHTVFMPSTLIEMSSLEPSRVAEVMHSMSGSRGAGPGWI